MKDPNLRALLNRLRKNHDQQVRMVVDTIEALVAERDAWEFKYQHAMVRIGELEACCEQRECGKGEEKTADDHKSVKVSQATHGKGDRVGPCHLPTTHAASPE